MAARASTDADLRDAIAISPRGQTVASAWSSAWSSLGVVWSASACWAGCDTGQHEEWAARVALQVVGCAAEHQTLHWAVAARADHEDVHLIAEDGQLLTREAVHRMTLHVG